jgi:hypothetical protein
VRLFFVKTIFVLLPIACVGQKLPTFALGANASPLINITNSIYGTPKLGFSGGLNGYLRVKKRFSLGLAANYLHLESQFKGWYFSDYERKYLHRIQYSAIDIPVSFQYYFISQKKWDAFFEAGLGNTVILTKRADIFLDEKRIGEYVPHFSRKVFHPLSIGFGSFIQLNEKFNILVKINKNNIKYPVLQKQLFSFVSYNYFPMERHIYDTQLMFTVGFTYNLK